MAPRAHIGMLGLWLEPESQVQGFCKHAMSVMTQAADEARMPCYLECTDTKRAHYEKFGFELTKQNIIRLGEGDELLDFPLCLMMQPCKTAHSLE
jgi:hypothetical protein